MAARATPSVATIILLLLLLIPTGSTVNNTAASASCNGSHREKCHLSGEEIANSEFLMESEIGRMLLNFNKFQGPQTQTPNKQAVASCGRPPRYDSCLGQKRQTPPQEKCNIYKRVPCGQWNGKKKRKGRSICGYNLWDMLLRGEFGCRVVPEWKWKCLVCLIINQFCTLLCFFFLFLGILLSMFSCCEWGFIYVFV